MNQASDDRISLGPVPVPPLGARLLVGLSGGLDSTVLLHLLAQNRISNLMAVHVHHGLQSAADSWVQHCASLCDGLGIELKILRVQVESDGKGIEAAARKARYQAIANMMGEGDVLAVAHHQDDQAETVLLRLLRGAGPQGLAAMRALRPLGPGQLWRPLLQIPRDVIRQYAETEALIWIEDAHNHSDQFARSFLRGSVMPLLSSRWPAARGNLCRAANLSADAAELLQALAEIDLANLAPSLAPLPIAALMKLSAPRRNNVLRHWIASFELPVPFQDSLARLHSEVIAAAEDATPLLSWPGAEVRRYRGHLFAMKPLPPPSADFCADWDGSGRLELPDGCGKLIASQPPNWALQTQVRLARPGDRFRPLGSPTFRTLKNLFQEHGVPTWVRVRTPVIEQDGLAIWTGGLGWASGAGPTGMRGEIQWLDAPPAAIFKA